MPKRVLIVAFGSAGRRHLETVRRELPEAEIRFLRRPESTGPEPEGAVVLDSLDAALEFAPDAAIVASPAPFHIATATRLAEAGADLLIEKPIADSMDGVAELLATAHAAGRLIQVGYCLRFDPSLKLAHNAISEGRIGRVISVRAQVGQYLPDWRPGTDWREGVSARAELGGGALLELSHEIDIARWFGGEVKSVRARIATLGDLPMDVENIADLLLEHESGAFGAVHLDMLRRSPLRRTNVVGTEGTIEWDGIAHAARLFVAGGGGWTTLSDGTGITMDLIVHEQFRHFLACVRTRTPPVVDGESGRRTLAVALAAKRSAAEERKITVD